MQMPLYDLTTQYEVQELKVTNGRHSLTPCDANV